MGKATKDLSMYMVFAKYGMQVPKKWERHRPLYKPKYDCFAYLNAPGKGEDCGCLNRLYCKYEVCSFYKKQGEQNAKRNSKEE